MSYKQFREMCVNLTQLMYRSEVKLQTNILGEPARHIGPLLESWYVYSLACPPMVHLYQTR